MKKIQSGKKTVSDKILSLCGGSAFAQQEDVDDLKKYSEYLPLYSARAACGKFGEQEIAEPDGWLRVSGVKNRNEKLFVVRAEGKSMEPLISDGAYCVFEYRGGTCDSNDIVLCEHSENLGEELTGAYTIKKFVGKRSEGGWSAARLVPENDDFDEIKLINKGHDVRAYRIVGVRRGEIEVIDD